jgi:uncharacterized membrane protein
MLKSPFKKIFLVLAIFAIPLCTAAQDYEEINFQKYNLYNWGIQNFHSDIEIHQNSSFTVTETIQADFTDALSRHGIIRYIPIQYQDKYKQNLSLRFSLLSVEDATGQEYETSVNYPGKDVSLRIGSANTYVDGEIKTYVIKYKLERGVNRFDDHDELFWNVTGNGWDTAISNASATVHLPSEVDSDLLKAICYTGYGYSTESDCQAIVKDGKTLEFATNNLLPANAGLTFAVAFPKKVVSYPSILTYLNWFFVDNWGYLLPLLVLIYLLYQWNKHGRDPEALHSTVMPEYEPPDNLRPAEIGTLIDDSVDMHDITSTIIDLATRGYLNIIEKKEKKALWGENTTYSLEKITPKDKKEQLQGFEQKIYDAIFGTKNKIELEDLKYKFYKEIPKIKTSLYETLVEKKYYAANPEKARDSYIGLGGGLFFISFFFLGFLIDINVPLFLGLILSSGLIFAFGFIMPKKTQLGADTRIHILGLEEFIKTAEKDRMKFYEDQNIFEKLLPYAIALGIADKWAKACEGLAKGSPDWYQSGDPNFANNFNTFYFLNSLNNFNSSMSSNMAASPRSSASSGSSGFSSGGGFSGGGFGGGGGSSW